MARLYKREELIERSKLNTKSLSLGGYIATDLYKAKAVHQLNENVRTFSKYKTYDIFLSHSIQNAQIINGLKSDLEERGFSVYVDWIEDAQLDRSDVTKESAELIRARISNCKCLIYAVSELSKQSSWVQWELGYADGNTEGKVAILPIEDPIMINNDFYKQEYLGLYPYIDKSAFQIWVNGVKFGNNNFCTLKEWL